MDEMDEMDATEDQPVEGATAGSKPLRFKADGTPDMRGRSAGSRRGQFTKDDGRKRPGRTRGSRDVKSEILRIRDMPVTVTLPNGRTKKVSTREAIFLRTRAKALNGDAKAADVLERRFERYDEVETEPDLTKALLAADNAILNSARARGLIPLLPLPEPLAPPALALPAPTPGDTPQLEEIH